MLFKYKFVTIEKYKKEDEKYEDFTSGRFASWKKSE